jgi:hypothetical protein
MLFVVLLTNLPQGVEGWYVLGLWWLPCSQLVHTGTGLPWIWSATQPAVNRSCHRCGEVRTAIRTWMIHFIIGLFQEPTGGSLAFFQPVIASFPLSCMSAVPRCAVVSFAACRWSG